MTIKHMDRVFFVYVYHKRKWKIGTGGTIGNCETTVNIVLRKIFTGLFCSMCNNDFVYHYFLAINIKRKWGCKIFVKKDIPPALNIAFCTMRSANLRINSFFLPSIPID